MICSRGRTRLFGENSRMVIPARRRLVVLIGALIAALLLAACATPRTAAESVDGPIVTVAWLEEALRSGPKPIIVAEASWAGAREAPQYRTGHIPGAIHVDTDIFENGSPRWHLRPVAELHAALGELGITPDATVIVYGRRTVTAARVWWVMEYAGVKDVRYLDGGIEAWRRAGFPVETAPVVLPRAKFDAQPREHVLATTSYVREHPNALLVDVRSAAEYRGEVSGYSYLDAKGRIPGARHAGNASDAERLYQDANGRLRSLGEIRERWREAGILNGREIVFYCGSGWRSSLAFLYARAMKLSRVRNYSDGWSGWSTVYEKAAGEPWRQRPSSLPVDRGEPDETRRAPLTR